MIEQWIYCTECPTTDEVKKKMESFGFQDDGGIEWPLRMCSPLESRPPYVSGRSNILLCYAPEKAPPEITTAKTARSTFFLCTDGRTTAQDSLFLGIVAGHLGTTYRGELYAPGWERICRNLSEIVEEKPEKVPIPEDVWRGLDAVRLTGLTNLLDRPAVIKIASALGYSSTARWISEHKNDYSEGIFRGFLPTRDESDQ